MAARTMITVEEFDRLQEDEFRYELDEGELITLTRPRRRHALIEGELYALLRNHVKAQGLGEVYNADILFVLGPKTKRAPDVSFMRRERLIGQSLDEEIQGAPDLCVEVRSPNNTTASLRRKISQFFAAGASLVWVVDPKKQEVEVWRGGEPVQTLCADEELTAPELLPGFALKVREIFPA